MVSQDKYKELCACLKADSFLDGEEGPVDWEYCGYNPPFTPGPFRRNEIWIDLHMTEEQVIATLAKATDSKPSAEASSTS